MQDKNKSDGNQLEVKWKSIGTSVQINQGLPPPSPAVPVGYYGPLTQEEAARRYGSKLSTSQSATSKADNTILFCNIEIHIYEILIYIIIFYII